MKRKNKVVKSRAVAVALLVERSLPTPEIRGLNPVMCKFICTLNCIETFEEIQVHKTKPAIANSIIFTDNFTDRFTFHSLYF